MVVAEHARVGSDLAQDGAGRRVVDAGESLQQAALLGVGRQSLVDVPVEVVHASAEGVVFVQQVGEQDAIRLAQFQAQGVAERVELAADMRTE